MDAAILAGFAGLAAIAFLAGALIVRPPFAPFSAGLFGCLLCMALWTAGEVISSQAGTVGVKHAGLGVLYTGSTFLAPVWLVTVLRWVRLHAPGVRPARCPGEAVPLALGGVLWLWMITNPWHGTFLEPVVGGRNVYGPGFWTLCGVNYTENVVTAALLGWVGWTHPRGDVRRAAVMLALATCVPLAANVVYVFSDLYGPSRLTGPVMAAAGAGAAFAVGWGRALWLQPVALRELVRRDRSGVVLLDRRRRPVYWNPAALEILPGLGLSPEPGALDALARRLRDAGSGAAVDDGEALLALLAEDAAPGRLLRDAEREDAWVRMEALPVVPSEDGPAPLALRIEDATGPVRAERSRQALARRLVEAEKLRSVSRLAAEIAHGFNNRLAVILGNADFVREELGADAPLAPLIDEIVEASEDAADLTRQLLAVAGRTTPSRQRVDLAGVVEAAAERMAERESETLALALEVGSLLPLVEVDPRQIEQAVVAVAHAVRARGGRAPVRLRLAVAAQTAGREVRVTVGCQGPPLAETERQRLLDPLGLGDDPGGGLELAAGLALLRANGGHLALERADDENRVHLVLPAAGPAAETPAAAGADVAWIASGAALVVDGEEAVRRVATAMLRRLGFRALSAADGHEAVDRVVHHRDALRVVLLDLSRSASAFDEALGAIRAVAPDLPVVATSGSAPDAEERTAIAKAAAFLPKPYRIEGLRETVRRVLSEARTSRPRGSSGRGDRVPSRAVAEQSLYERIGGDRAVERLIGRFYRRVLADPDLAPFFEDVRMEKLQRMQHEFFAAALGGPVSYSGRPLTEIHAGLGIQPRHVQRFMDHLMATLRDQSLDEDDVYEIASRINLHADQITGTTTVDG